MTPIEIFKLSLAAQLHDIGKFYISEDLLNKADELTKEEIEKLRNHVLIGVEQLEKNDINKDIIEIVRHHHENYDGSGYPDKLSGDDISIYSRIIKLCDVYDALTHKRVYRKIIYHKDVALRIMESMENEFDPKLFKKFKEYIMTNLVENKTYYKIK